MAGSRFPSLIDKLAPRGIACGRFPALLGAAIVFAVGAMPGGIALAADPVLPDTAAVGMPIVLFSPETPAAAAKPVRTVTAAPGKRPVAASTHPGPTTVPLIPPAPMPAKLGPPPGARPALPLKTDLQPLAAPPDAPQPDGEPAADKPRASLTR